jgi:hypothetical protein
MHSQRKISIIVAKKKYGIYLKFIISLEIITILNEI